MNVTERQLPIASLPRIEDTQREQFLLDEKAAESLASPSSEEECLQIIQHARQEGIALVPWGGGTDVQQGNLLETRRWIAFHTAKMGRLLEYSPPDMVVTVQAGMPLSELQKALRQHNQFLPFDPPCADRATMGGIVATNRQGLLRPGFGTPRDRLLGLRVAMANGTMVKGGGKVVKNVAGYDLCKLFTGSFGTLGLITEVTFKTNPLPERQAHILFSAVSAQQAAEAALAVHLARLQPASLSVACHREHYLYVGLIGSREATEWQERAISDILIKHELQRSEAGLTDDEIRRLISDHPSPVKVKLAVRPSETPEALQQLLSHGASVLCHVPTGILEAALPAETALINPHDFNSPISQLQRRIPQGGHLIWTRLPASWKETMDVWGAPRADFALMQGIKRALDPYRIFSPGRFFGRL
jgi:glycolate oxidase FAD binding subunit